MASCTHRFIAIYSAGTNDTDRQLAFFHFTYLCIAGMCAEQPVGILLYVKCILNITGRVMLWQVKCSKVVKIIFDLRAFGNGKPEPLKNRNDPVLHHCYRVSCTKRQFI